MKKIITWICMVVLALVWMDVSKAGAEAYVAPHVAKALDTKTESQYSGGNIHAAVMAVVSPFMQSRTQQVRLCTEYADQDAVKTELEGIMLKPGTLREQLDAAVARYDYSWQALGEWIVLTPRSVLGKEEWFPAHKVGSPVVVCSYYDCSDLAREHKAMTVGQVRRQEDVRVNSRAGLVATLPGKARVVVKAPEPAILADPSWREVLLTSRAQNGTNLVQWLVLLEDPLTGGKSIHETTQTAQPLMLFMEEDKAAKAAEEGPSEAESGE